MDTEELKQRTTDRLDYEDNVVGKEHSAYRGHYYAGVLAIVAKLEAAQRLRDAVRPFCKIAEGTVGRIPTERLSCANWHELWKAAKAFDKEQQ